MTKITWAPIIPLIGGFPLGAETTIGHAPEFIGSYDGFASNDSHYVNHQQVTLGRTDMEYKIITNDTPKGKLNIVVGTPPCAALSQLNTGKSAAVKGSGCAKNEWMYEVFKDAIDRYDADVVMIENAPALYTTKGKGVADKLYELVKERGYSLTLYKTSTMYHGIPQNRDRTFAIAWKSKTAPVMDFYDRPRKNFKQFLTEDVSPEMLHQDLIINEKVANEPFYNYLKHLYPNTDIRELLVLENIKTTFNYVNCSGRLADALNWFKETNNEAGIKVATHAMKKFDMGMGIWDGSVHVFGEYMNAVIGRNMVDTIHPFEERSLTVREALALMGFPSNFELLGGKSKMNHIAQNVPVCTAADMVEQAVKFIRGELPMSDTDYLKQNNHNKTILKEGLDFSATTDEFFN